MKLCVFILLFMVTSSWAAPRLVSKAVSQVKGSILTTRDVEINDVAEQILFSKTKIEQIKPITKDKTKFSGLVSNLILDWVTYYESQLFPLIKMNSQEKNRAEALFRSANKKSKYWRSLEVGPGELKQLIQRKILAKKFVNFKSKSSDVPITEAEAKVYFERNKSKFGTLPFENFSREIKLHLSQEQKQKRLKDWFEILHAKYKVKRFYY